MKLSIIVPTVNRPSLARALSSCGGIDEVIVVADGPEAHGAASAFRASGLPGRVVLLSRRYQDFGHTPRQIGLAYCTGDFIGYLDDDDAFVPDVAALLRESLSGPLPHFFRVDFADLGLVWREPVLRLGNVSTIGIFHPNDKRWGQWSHRYEGDFDFASSMSANYPGVRWIDRVVASGIMHGHGQ